VRFTRPAAPLLAVAAVLLAACGPDAGPVAPDAGRPLAAVSAGRVTRRPIEEFVAAQGYCLLPGNPNNCDISVAGIDLLVFVDRSTGNQIVLDYNGIAAAYLRANGGPDLGTTFSGTVTERVLNDGRAQITVVLHTESALTFVDDVTAPAFGTVIRLGATPAQVLAGAPVALGSSTIRLTYIAPEPGMPLVDLGVTLFEPDTYEVVKFGFQAQAEGVLHAASGYPEGTVGLVRAKELDRFTPGLLRRGEPFRVEHIRLSPLMR
jgi:hypothetical protein